ncbi:WD40 repeat domain-containing protein [Endozoicomonadaceae bacterium StTr2]
MHSTQALRATAVVLLVWCMTNIPAVIAEYNSSPFPVGQETRHKTIVPTGHPHWLCAYGNTSRNANTDRFTRTVPYLLKINPLCLNYLVEKQYPFSEGAHVTVSPSGQLAVTSGFTGKIEVYDTVDMEHPVTVLQQSLAVKYPYRPYFSHHAGYCFFSPDGKYLVFYHSPPRKGYSAYMKIWSVSGTTGCFDFTPVRSFKIPSHIQSPEPEQHQPDTYSCVFSPNGRWLATAHQDTGQCQLWDFEQLVNCPESAVEPLFEIDFHYLADGPDDTRIVYNSVFDGSKRELYYPESGRQATEMITLPVFSPDSRHLIMDSEYKLVMVNLDNPAQPGVFWMRHSLQHQWRRQNTITVSPDSRYLVHSTQLNERIDTTHPIKEIGVSSQWLHIISLRDPHHPGGYNICKSLKFLRKDYLDSISADGENYRNISNLGFSATGKYLCLQTSTISHCTERLDIYDFKALLKPGSHPALVMQKPLYKSRSAREEGHLEYNHGSFCFSAHRDEMLFTCQTAEHGIPVNKRQLHVNKICFPPHPVLQAATQFKVTECPRERDSYCHIEDVTSRVTSHFPAHRSKKAAMIIETTPAQAAAPAKKRSLRAGSTVKNHTFATTPFVLPANKKSRTHQAWRWLRTNFCCWQEA